MIDPDRRDVIRAAAAAGLFAATGLRAAAARTEAAIDPHRPILDAHHHLRGASGPTDKRPAYGLAEYLAEIDRSGHNVTRSVFIECGTMYRSDGPVPFRPVGETMFVRDIADHAPDRCHVASAIVGYADLRLGAAIRPVLEAHVEAGGGRFRGIRNSSAWDPSPVIGAMPADRKDLLSDPGFRAGFGALAPLGLSFDAWVYHPQLAAVTDLATAFPDTTIILNHLGTPIGSGPYAAHPQETMAVWRAAMAELARRPNVMVKLGGLGPFFADPPAQPDLHGSRALARQWRPYVETAIALFGPARCMFESNFPSNAFICNYGILWNIFKRIARDYSPDEQAALFGAVAARCYRIAPSKISSSAPSASSVHRPAPDMDLDRIRERRRLHI